MGLLHSNDNDALNIIIDNYFIEFSMILIENR